MIFILPHLAVGTHEEARAQPSGIDALLCVAAEKDIPYPAILSHKIPIIDMQPIPPGQLHEAVEWIRDHINESRILVFCNEGVGRSPSVVVAYLCCVEGYSFGWAVEFVATRKPAMSILPELITSIEEVKRLMAKPA
jgi:protein-tyrosine phosphatase